MPLFRWGQQTILNFLGQLSKSRAILMFSPSLIWNSLIHSGDLYSASSRHYYSQPSHGQRRRNSGYLLVNSPGVDQLAHDATSLTRAMIETEFPVSQPLFPPKVTPHYNL